MSTRTVDWSATGEPQGATAKPEGLRERKKRLMRQQLSDTATELFPERGFDAVRVAEDQSGRPVFVCSFVDIGEVQAEVSDSSTMYSAVS